jgi:regulator of sigma E protease
MMESLLAVLHWSVYGIPAFIFLITMVVFFHELGHFAVARFFNTRVETFSIGFGPAIVKWTDRKGTLWKISWIPLGGFVKFFGDADGASTPDREAAAAMSPEDRKVAFPYKPLYQRALIVVAGPVANFILAFVILAGFFLVMGRTVTPPIVGKVAAHSAGEAAGIHVGDRIVSVDGTAIDSYLEIEQIVSISSGQRLPIELERGTSHLTVWATPRDTTMVDQFKNKQQVGDLGIDPFMPSVIDSVQPGSPAQRAGLRAGDRIVAIGGWPTVNFDDVQRIVGASPGKSLTLAILRDGRNLSVRATPFFNADSKRGQLGFIYRSPGVVQHLGPLGAAGAAVGRVRDIVAMTFRSREQLFKGNTSQLAGPVGILKLSGQVAEVSFLALVQLVALLSVSIGLVNLFPIPLLDGGHLLYYACEGVLRRPLSERAQDVGFRLGLAVVLGIFILATWNDLVRLNLF